MLADSAQDTPPSPLRGAVAGRAERRTVRGERWVSRRHRWCLFGLPRTVLV